MGKLRTLNCRCRANERGWSEEGRRESHFVSITLTFNSYFSSLTGNFSRKLNNNRLIQKHCNCLKVGGGGGVVVFKDNFLLKIEPLVIRNS